MLPSSSSRAELLPLLSKPRPHQQHGYTNGHSHGVTILKSLNQASDRISPIPTTTIYNGPSLNEAGANNSSVKLSIPPSTSPSPSSFKQSTSTPATTGSTSATSEATSKHEFMGYILMFSSAICFSVHSLCIRVSETFFHVPFTANILVRGIIHCTLCASYFHFSSSRVSQTVRSTPSLFRQNISRKSLTLLVLRGVIGAVSLFLLYNAVNFIEVGLAVSIFFVTSVITIVLSRSILLEPITGPDVTAVILCLAGVYLITTSTYETSATASLSDSDKLYGKLLVASGSILASATYTIIRYIGMDVSFMTSVFSFAVSCLLGAVFTGGFNELCVYASSVFAEKSVKFSVGSMLSIVAAAVASFMAQCGLNAGLQKCRAGAGVLITNVEVPFTFFLAFLFLNETPGIGTIVGSSLILLGAVIVGANQLLEKRRRLHRT